MISKFASEILDKILSEIKKKQNMDKIHNNLIDPLIYYCLKRLYPYFLSVLIIFILLFIVAVLILILLVRNIYSS